MTVKVKERDKFMFFRKCKKCGGKMILVNADIDVNISGVLQKVTNVPAKQCTECGNIVVNECVLARIKQYAQNYPANILDFAKCEDEEGAAASSIL